MKLLALMSFFDEPVESLISAVASLQLAGVDHVVACDGRFSLYPSEHVASDSNQHAAIVMTCRELGIACTLHVPSAPFERNEPEKRTALFALGWALAENGDWFMVHDADTAVTRWDEDVRARLAESEAQVAKVEVLDVVALRAQQLDWPPTFEYCGLFRAQPITVGPHHAVYTGADGQKLWVGNGEDAPVPVLDLTRSVQVEHRPDHRSLERQIAKQGYYNARDESRVERGDCERCGNPAVTLVPTRWRMTHIGPAGAWAEACEPCAKRYEAISRRQLRQLGVANPDQVSVENRNGKAPTGMTA